MLGDGCPFYNSAVYNSTSFHLGISADAFGNVIIQDYNGYRFLRVLYAGGANNPMAKAIKAYTPSVTPTAGYTYPIAGAGSGAAAVSTPRPGNTSSLTNMNRTYSDPNGNVYIGASTNVYFLDVNTDYVRQLASSGVSPAPSFTGGSSTLGVALDNLGNLYMADGGDKLIRRMAAAGPGPTAVGSSATATLMVHAPAGTTAIGATTGTNAELTLGTKTCTTNAGDGTYDCSFPITFAPAQLGLRSNPVTISTTPATATISTAAMGTGTGSALVFDPASPTNPTTSTVGTFTSQSAAVDTFGNAYSVDTGAKQIRQISGTAATAIGSAQASAPSSVAVDPLGNVYAGTASSPSLLKLSLTAPSTFTAGTVTNAAFAGAKAIAVDANGNVFVADNTTKKIVRFSQTGGVATTLTGALNNPVALAFDTSGNLLVADSGASTLYRVPVTGIAGTPPSVTLTGTVTPVPVGVAVDAAGNIYVADSANKTIAMVPVSGSQTTIASGFSASLNGVAVDGAGNVYVSDAGATGLTKIVRTGFSYSVPDTNTTVSGTLTNAGNATATSFGQTDSGDFNLTNSPATCNTASTAIYAGASCTIAAKFTPATGTTGTVTDTVQLGPTASTLGSILLTGTASGSSKTTATTIGGQTPTGPIYATGSEVTFTVTVTASPSGNPTGTVNVSIDGGTATSYPLTAGAGTTSTATVSLRGLTAAMHTIAATYPGSGSYVGSSTSSATSFAIAQAATAVTWSPTVTSEPVSQAIGTGVFNAYATSGGVTIPGTFVYTATPSGGAATGVDSASYLGLGTYSFGVTFTPTDAVDYSGSTGAVNGFTVIKATPTAAVSASTMVVAASGGNYTSVQAAVGALPATGGSIYIAPGTYTGQILVSYPNVSIRGLGGSPSNVLLTAENGAFPNPVPSGYGLTNNPFGFNNDEGSATLTVAKSSYFNGTSYTPSNFYLDNLTIQNTYDTDTTNTNSIVGSNQTCTGTSSSSNNALFNSGTLCASQALAVWITADKTVFNNVRLLSLQDTIYNGTGSSPCTSNCTSTRQYYWKNYITGDIDYVFGDAAAVYDQTTFYTQYHNGSNTGNATIFAQNKGIVNGGNGDYLSGYVANNSLFTSQNTPTGAMTALYFGRPYGAYATSVLLGSQVDDVNSLGWQPFSGANLPTAYYYEYGTTCTTANCTTTGRETTSQVSAGSTGANPTGINAAYAAKYTPTTFLSTPAPDVWVPPTALTTGVNGYVPTATAATIAYGSSITILAKPQTPGGGTIPTGTYTLTDNASTIASGTLDASGAMYLTSGTWAPGTHSLAFNYAGDANFNASSSTAFTLTVNGTSTTDTVAVTTTSPTYGQSVTVTATVAATGGTPTGTVALSVDGGTATNATLASGVATFTLTGLSAGTHSLSAVYQGAGAYTASTGTGSVTLAKAPLTVTAGSFSRLFETANPSLTYTLAGFVSPDSAATSVTGTAALSTTVAPNSTAGTYPISVAVGSLSATNYSFGSLAAGVATVTVPGGGVPQTIVFPAIPTFPVGSTIPLFARSLSGLPVTYTVTGGGNLATISGRKLVVSGAGTITVTAMQTGNATFAAATSVSRSFTAQ